MHSSGHPYHQHSRYSSVFYHYISDLAMSSQTDVLSKFQLSDSQSRVNKILLAAFLHPGSVHEISWLDHFTAVLGVLQLITQIFTFSEGETKCINPSLKNFASSSPFLWGFDRLKQMNVKTTRCTAQGIIKRSEHLRAAVLQHPNSQQSTRRW